MKQFRPIPLLVAALMLAAVFSPSARAEKQFITPEMSGMENVLNIIGNLNLSQMDAKSDASVLDLLDAKSQMYQQHSKLLPGRATAQTAHDASHGRKLPPARRLERSF